MTAAGPDARPRTGLWSRLEAFVSRRWVRRAAAALVVVGFTTLVSVYMQVVNRYVHYSVRVQASRTAEPGSSVALRLTIYRPGALMELQGHARIGRLAPDGGLTPLADEPLTSTVLTPFNLAVPADASGSLALRIDVTVSGEDERRRVDIRVPVATPAPSGEAVAGLAETDASRPVALQSQMEQAHVSRVRTTPDDAPVDVAIVSESGFPVRFLENVFYVRVSDRLGTPLSGRPLVVHVADGEQGERSVDLVTDAHGLAELAVTPSDVASWWVETSADDGTSVRADFEVVPGFDGLMLRLERPIVGLEDRLDLRVDSALTAPHWYADVRAGDTWLASVMQPMARTRGLLAPPGGRWGDIEDRPRLGTVQIVTSPFSQQPQSSVRGVLLRPTAMSDRQAVRALLDGLGGRPPDAAWVAALRRLGAPLPQASDTDVQRLANFLLARRLPTVAAPPVAYDDTDSQTSALLASTTTFRTRAHWLIGVGVAGLMAWISGIAIGSSVRTRRRTQAVLAELTELEIDPSMAAHGMGEGLAAVVPVVFGLFTIGLFFVGVLWMLAVM